MHARMQYIVVVAMYNSEKVFCCKISGIVSATAVIPEKSIYHFRGCTVNCKTFDGFLLEQREPFVINVLLSPGEKPTRYY